jgi:hypothetical protein
MAETLRRRLCLLAALLPPLVLLGWRLADCPPERLWRDGAALLSLYGVFVVVAPESRVRQPVTIAVMLLLLAVYGAVQVPLAFEFLRQAW